MNMDQELKVYFKIAFIAFILIFVIHVLSSIWFFIVNIEQRWVQNMDFMYVSQEKAYHGFFEGQESFTTKYLLFMYTGFYVFGVGEVVPRASESEFMFAFILLSLCTILNAIIIGIMTSFIEELSSKSSKLANKINLTNTAMLNLNLRRDLKNKILKYIHQTHTTSQLQQELENFMKQISPDFKRRVTREVFITLV